MANHAGRRDAVKKTLIAMAVLALAASPLVASLCTQTNETSVAVVFPHVESKVLFPPPTGGVHALAAFDQGFRIGLGLFNYCLGFMPGALDHRPALAIDRRDLGLKFIAQSFRLGAQLCRFAELGPNRIDLEKTGTCKRRRSMLCGIIRWRDRVRNAGSGRQCDRPLQKGF